MTVYTASLRAPNTLKRPSELATRFATLVAAELGPEARVIQGLAAEGRQQVSQTASSGQRFVALRIEIAERVTLDAELSQGVRRFWDRFKPGVPGALAAAHESGPLDAEIRSYFPPLPLIVQRIDKQINSDEPSVALACGDVDGDGSVELVSVGRYRIRVGRFIQGRFVVEQQVAWSNLTGVAPRPLRDPIGVVQILEGKGLLVGLSDRAEALELSPELAVTSRYPNRLPWPPDACAERAGLGVSAVPRACTMAKTRPGGVPPAAAAETEGTLDAIAGLRLTRADGRPLAVLARRELGGRLTLSIADREVGATLQAGAGVAIADLNADGAAELLSSEDTLDPASDALTVRSLSASNALEPALRLAVPAGIHAIAACPTPPQAMAPIVLSTGDGFWVLR